MNSTIGDAVALLPELKKLAEKATPGPWEVDTLQNEGDYGNGEDVQSGFTSYVVCAGNKGVVDTLNSDLAMVEVDGDCDENGPRSWAWDETGRRNAEYIAAANPETILKIIAALEAITASKPEAGSVTREALKPFAEVWKALNTNDPGADDRIRFNIEKAVFTVGDLRRASEAYAALLPAPGAVVDDEMVGRLTTDYKDGETIGMQTARYRKERHEAAAALMAGEKAMFIPKPTEAMIITVAKAIHAEAHGNQPLCDDCKEYARAAIEALKHQRPA